MSDADFFAGAAWVGVALLMGIGVELWQSRVKVVGGSENGRGVEEHAREGHSAASTAEPRSLKLAITTAREGRTVEWWHAEGQTKSDGDGRSDGEPVGGRTCRLKPSPHHGLRESEPTAGIKPGRPFSELPSVDLPRREGGDARETRVPVNSGSRGGAGSPQGGPAPFPSLRERRP